MHIMLGVLGILGAAAFWYYRLKYVAGAANEVADTIGRVRGKIRRSRIRKQASESPITAIDDPVIAAAALMAIVADDDGTVGEIEQTILDELKQLTSSEAADEAWRYAAWATRQVTDGNLVVVRLSRLLNDSLNNEEKQQLVRMVERVSVANGEATHEARNVIATLKRRLLG